MVNFTRNYNYFIFDWDGTLAKTTHALINAYKKAFLKRGLILRNEQLREEVFGNWEDAIRKFAVPGSKKVFEEITQEVSKDILKPDLYDGVLPMLKKLHKSNKKLGLLTLVERSLVEPALKFHDIEKYFDYIVTGTESQEKKPDPRPLIKVQMGLNALYSETVYIGNSTNDVLMGKSAKLVTGIFTPEENKDFFDYTKITLAKPDFIFGDFSYLTKKYI